MKNLIFTTILFLTTIPFLSAQNVPENTLASVTEMTSLNATPAFEVQEIQQNTIAVLPTYFILEDNFNKSYSQRVQSYILDLLSRKRRKISVRPANQRKVNSALYKANLTPEDIHNMPVEDLCKMMGTEYIMVSEVTKIFEGMDEDTQFGATSNENGVAGAINKDQEKDYVTSTHIWIYDNNGEVVFEKTVRPFNIGAHIHFENEAWKGQVKNLVKKMPFYKRR